MNNTATGGRRRIRLIIGSIVGTIVVVLGSVGVAGAHHPEIVAEVDCDFVISYTATAWVGTIADSRHNNVVEISVDGSPVATGEFTAANGYTFSGQFQATPGTTYTVRATALVRWGVAEDRGAPGEWRETTVTVPPACTQQTTTTTTTTTTTAPSTSTTPPPTTPSTPTAPASTPTTTVPTVVAGDVVVSQPAQPVPAQPTFTG